MEFECKYMKVGNRLLLATLWSKHVSSTIIPLFDGPITPLIDWAGKSNRKGKLQDFFQNLSKVKIGIKSFLKKKMERMNKNHHKK